MSSGRNVNDRPWAQFHGHWRQLKPPLLPNSEVVETVAASIRGRERRVLLLGVTPPLAGLGADLTAIDWSDDMIARVWPGDTAQRRVRKVDWRSLLGIDGDFSAVIGDGSFNCLEFPHDAEGVFAELARVLAPGGRFAVRFFTTPSPAEDIADIRAAAERREFGAVDSLKWRLASVVAAETGDPNVERGAIYDAFQRAFPDRAGFLTMMGWPDEALSGVDWYKGIADTIAFPTRDQILATVPKSFTNARFVPSGTYEMAERCPILTLDFHP